MNWYSDWFLADEDEAVASIATDDEGHTFDDWPHLSMRSVGETELEALWAILRGRRKRPARVSELLLVVDEEVGPAVGWIVPEFIGALAAVKKTDVPTLAGMWHKCECLSELEAETVRDVLREMTGFARRAKRAKKPVLELSTW